MSNSSHHRVPALALKAILVHLIVLIVLIVLKLRKRRRKVNPVLILLILLLLPFSASAETLSLEEMLGAYSGYSMPCLWNGILTFWLKQVDENGNDAGAYYYYKLDGSMKKPELCNPPLPYVNHQNAFIGQTVCVYHEITP